jgi:hypothetical protein
MQSLRKIQLSAAAVIANGLLVLGTTTPTTALAAGCADHNYVELCVCAAPGGSRCQTVPGCTVNEQCVPWFYDMGCHISTYCQYS